MLRFFKLEIHLQVGGHFSLPAMFLFTSRVWYALGLFLFCFCDFFCFRDWDPMVNHHHCFNHHLENMFCRWFFSKPPWRFSKIEGWVTCRLVWLGRKCTMYRLPLSVAGAALLILALIVMIGDVAVYSSF